MTLLNKDGQISVVATPKALGGMSVVRHQSSGNSTTRATVYTPAEGKRIRVLSLRVYTTLAAAFTRFEVYFHTGANIGTNAGKEIFEAVLSTTTTGPVNAAAQIPPGGWKLGGVDEVLSFRTNIDLGSNAFLLALVRDEDF